MLDFTKDFLMAADIDSGSVRAGILSYSTNVKVHFHLNTFQSRAEVFAAIDDIAYTAGSTNTADAIETMYTEMFTPENGDRSDIPSVVIIITDGVSNINNRKTIPRAEEARTSGISIYAIGIGLTETAELKGIASRPVQDYLFLVQNFTELEHLKQTLFDTFCLGNSVLSLELTGQRIYHV